MHTTTRHLLTLATLAAPVLLAAGDATAQCPTALSQRVLNTIQTPQIRAAAQGFRIDPAMIASNGGIDTMLRLSHEQLTADRAAVREEQANQAYLAKDGINLGTRVEDGQLAIRMLEESQRLTSASIEIMECYARGATGAGESREGAPRHGAEIGVPATPPPGRSTNSDLMQALDSLNQSLRQKAMANATPEYAAFLAKQDALQAAGQANMAALNAGTVAGRDEALRASSDAQMQMVRGVVSEWKAPKGYAAVSHRGAANLADPFAPAASLPWAVTDAIGASGLVWNRARSIAQAGATDAACHNRLRPLDYPVLPDGALLETATQIRLFLRLCSGPTLPVLIIRENGDFEVRR
jgi:predicted transcriptional regulator